MRKGVNFWLLTDTLTDKSGPAIRTDLSVSQIAVHVVYSLRELVTGIIRAASHSET